MLICPACSETFDEAPATKDRCPHCGGPLRNVPQRTIRDLSQDIKEDDGQLKPPGELETVVPGEIPIQLNDADDDDQQDSVDPDTIATYELGTEGINLEEHQEEESEEGIDPNTIATFELGSEGINLDDLDEDTKEGKATVAIGPEQTIDFTGSSIDIEELEDDEDDSAAGGKPATVAMGAEQTIDFSSSSDLEADADSMVTTNWLDNISGGDASQTNATIKQKDTVTDGSITSSSLVVKSRQFRTGEEVGKPFTSAADAPDYELLNKIGEGGMGVVYSARQSSIARTVAIKMLKSKDAESADQREKFISEAVVTGELDHPNIVPIYDLGSNDSGALFYSMKRVKGTPWDDVISDKSLDENINILLRVADAVAFAHANGVLHRDLKPENVMLGDFGEVLVMDWGLARISPDFPSADAVSQSDVMGGTPAYMAPEMATGPIDQITTASDIYLLGAILYEVISGKPPHTGKTVMACLFSAAKNKIVSTDKSGELVDIALKAMATQPADRYATVQDFQQALRQYLSHSESVILTASATANLNKAQEDNDYDLFSRAMYGFEEALSLWDGNRVAQEMLGTSKAAYAKSALDRGDFDLGISLLDPEDEHHTELLTQLNNGRQERESRNRRLKFMRRMVAALLAAVVAIVSIAYFAVRAQRNEAVAQRDRAVKAEGEALENFQAAEEARKVAVTQRDRAVKAEGEALENFKAAEAARQVAEEEKERAEREEARAKEQEQIAVKAKQAEEYEAYVARIGLANAKIDENAFDRADELLMQCNPELCDWEWGRLLHLCRLSNNTWKVDGPVEAVAYSPDGKYFATGDWEGKVRLWDRATGANLHTNSHGQYVHAVDFNPAGDQLASGSSDHTIRIINVEDGQILQTLEGHSESVLSVRFSHDGKLLVSAGNDNTAKIWDLESGEVLQTLQEHSWWVWDAEFSPDDQRLVTVSQDGNAIVWQQNESGDYEFLTEFTRHKGPIYAAKFSPDGTHIATAGYDRRVLLWNPDEVEPIDIARRLDNLPDPPAPYHELAIHDGPVRSVVFSQDGNLVASGGQDNVIRLWHLDKDREVAVLRGHASHVRDCTFSPDDKFLLSAGRDQQIKSWQPASYSETIVLGGLEAVEQNDAVLDARFSRDGSQIITASRDRTASLWDVDSQSLKQVFSEGHEFLASSSVFFSGGGMLATGAGDGTVRIWDVVTGTQILLLKGTGRTAALAVSEDNQWLATGGPENEAIIWDAQTGEKLATLAGHEAAVTAVSFSPDNLMLATADDRGRARIWNWDATTQQWVGSHWLIGHSRSISAIEFTKDGKEILTASGDNSCGQWDVATGREFRDRVLSHPEWVADMAVTADGSTALTCSDDGKLRLWSLDDARVLRTLEPTENVVFTAVDLCPDGRHALATCAAKGTVHIWDMETGQEILGDSGDEAWLSFGGRAGIVWAARYSPDASQVLTIGGNDARIWDVETREPVVRFSPHGAVAAADISPDGKLVVTGSWDQTAKIWNAETGQALLKLDGVHQGYVNSVEFSPNGKLVLTASDDGTARLWDVSTGSPLDTAFRGHQSRVRQALFSQNGSQILTTSNDKTAKIWDANTGETVVTLVGHEWGVLCGAFSPDGKRVITGSEDNTAIIWDASTGIDQVKLSGHTDSITSVAFSPDGARVLTGSQDNVAKLWDAHTGKEILTLIEHQEPITSVSFSPDGLSALTSGRDGATILWPALDWQAPRARQATKSR